MTPVLIICAALVMSDGDSGRCDGQRVRLHGVDAPEVAPFTRCRQRPDIWACQTGPRAFAGAARDRARQLVRDGAQCEIMDRDRYGRTVARCTVDGRDLGEILVSEGLAIADPTFGRDYRAAEGRARREGRGVWR